MSLLETMRSKLVGRGFTQMGDSGTVWSYEANASHVVVVPASVQGSEVLSIGHFDAAQSYRANCYITDPNMIDVFLDQVAETS